MSLISEQTELILSSVEKIHRTSGHSTYESYKLLLDYLAWKLSIPGAKKPDIEDEVLGISDMKLLLNCNVHDFLGRAFEELGLQSRRRGQFFTPENVSDFMAQMMISRPPENLTRPLTILDPACGSGRLLLAAFRRLGNRAIYFGCDIDLLAYRICLLNMRIFRVPSLILCGDSLRIDLSPNSPNWRFANRWDPPNWDDYVKIGRARKASEEQKRVIKATRAQAEMFGGVVSIL